MMGRRLPVALLLGLAPGLFAIRARADGDPAAGMAKIRSLQCQSCHGRNGIARQPGVPNLAGQVQDYLASTLRAYRSGNRRNEVMNAVAAKLGDGDIADLSAYYAAVQPTVKPPAP